MCLWACDQVGLADRRAPGQRPGAPAAGPLLGPPRWPGLTLAPAQRRGRGREWRRQQRRWAPGQNQPRPHSRCAAGPGAAGDPAAAASGGSRTRWCRGVCTQAVASGRSGCGWRGRRGKRAAPPAAAGGRLCGACAAGADAACAAVGGRCAAGRAARASAAWGGRGEWAACWQERRQCWRTTATR
jgi:hypothetical protein